MSLCLVTYLQQIRFAYSVFVVLLMTLPDHPLQENSITIKFIKPLVFL